MTFIFSRNPYSEAIPNEPIRFGTNFFLRIKPDDLHVLTQSLFRSYTERTCTLPLNSFSRVMPAMPAHSHPTRELSWKCMYALTPSRVTTGHTCTLSLQSLFGSYAG